MSVVEERPGRTQAPEVIDLTGDASPAEGPRSGPLSTDLVTTVSELCSVAEQLEGVARRHAGDPDLVERVTRLVVTTRRAVDDLVVSAGERRRDAIASSRSAHPAGTALRDAEVAFDAWLAAADHPEQVRHDGRSIELREVLTSVLPSRRPLGARVARELGVPAGTTAGCAAAWLLVAVDDPAGPRCRSYRSAFYYLRDVGDPAVLAR